MSTKVLIVPPDLLDQLANHLAQHIGLFFSKKNRKDLEKKLTQITHKMGFEDPIAGVKSLLQGPLSKEQIDILAFYLTIGETYFFRDSYAFAILESNVLPEIIQSHLSSCKQIRIWCAASATGEEPYSIAMVLHKLMPYMQEGQVKIIGTDINKQFLEKARAGQYKKWSLRATPEEFINRYFTVSKDGVYTVSSEIRKFVEFHYLNLVEQPYQNYVPEIRDMDLIVCCNVLIYFSHQQVHQTILNLENTLRRGGWLYVSAIETPFVKDVHMQPVSFKRATLFCKTSVMTGPVIDPEVPAKPAIPKTIQVENPYLVSPKTVIKPTIAKGKSIPERNDEIYDICKSLYEKGRYNDVILQLEQQLASIPHHPKKVKNRIKEVILLIHAYANQGKLPQARSWCEQALAVEKLDPILHCLYATILQEQQQDADSLTSLKKALYLDQDSIFAHFSAGIASLRLKEEKEGKHYLLNALELLQKFKPEDEIPGMEGVSAERLINIIHEHVKPEKALEKEGVHR